jgi:hypothetical protein
MSFPESFSLLEVLMWAVWGYMDIELFWPISEKSLQQWCVLFCLMMVWWYYKFILNMGIKPLALRQDEHTQNQSIVLRMKAVLQHVKVQAPKQLGDGAEKENPGAKLLYSLLWDDTREVRITAHGEQDVHDEIEALFNRCHEKELNNTIRLTRAARKSLSKIQDAEDLKDNVKELAEHASGEKLHAAIIFAGSVQKNLGPSCALPEKLLEEAKVLANHVSENSAAKQKTLFLIMKPGLPLIGCMVITVILNAALRAQFQTIGTYAEIIETAKDDLPLAYTLLFNCWVGQLLIEGVQRLESCCEHRSYTRFIHRLRVAMMGALVQQDTEYFDKISPGVVQERFSRDTQTLADNLLALPRRNLARVVSIVVSAFSIFYSMPLDFCIVAMLPLVVGVPIQYFAFRYTGRLFSRQSKIHDENVASTSQILREIKTIRQFAMEPWEAARHGRQGLASQIECEEIFVKKRICDLFFWCFFFSMFCVTLYLGIPHVTSGAMKISQLLGVITKINFEMAFPLRSIFDDIPLIEKTLPPLGRICDLLEAVPAIEPRTDPAYVDVANAVQMQKLLSLCETTDKAAAGDTDSGKSDRTVLTTSRVSLSFTKSSISDPAPVRNAQLVFLRSADLGYKVVTDKQALLDKLCSTEITGLARLSYPVRAVFSKGLRPAHFKGQIEFKNGTTTV